MKNIFNLTKQYFQRERGVKMGIFRKRVISKAPVHNLTVTGQKTLKHGQLVSCTLKLEINSPDSQTFVSEREISKTGLL